MTSLEKYSPLLFLLMWSSGAIFVKLGLEDASVSIFLTVRAVGAACVLLLVCFYVAGVDGAMTVLRLPLPSVLMAVLMGLILQVGYQAAYFSALHHHLTPGVLAIILGFQPLLTPVFANEKIGKRGYLYLLLGLLGLTVAVFGAREFGTLTGMGLLFGIVSVLAISIGSVMQKRSLLNPLASAFYQTATASCVFLILLPFTHIRLEVTPTFIMSASWMIVVVSTLGVLLLFRMLATGSASKVGMLFYLVPIVTMSLDYIVFGNGVSGVTFAGAALILLAVRGFSKVHLGAAIVPSDAGRT